MSARRDPFVEERFAASASYPWDDSFDIQNLAGKHVISFHHTEWYSPNSPDVPGGGFWYREARRPSP